MAEGIRAGTRLESAGDSAEMIADDGEFYRGAKLPWTAEEDAPEEFPVIVPTAFPDAEHPKGLDERAQITRRKPYAGSLRTVIFEKRSDPLVINFWLVEAPHEVA